MKRLAMLVVVAACSGKSASTGGGSGGGSSTAVVDPCSASALGLGSATELPNWTPQNGCDLRHAAAPALLTDLQAIADAIDCSRMGGGGDPLVFDGPIVVMTRSWSPAQTGLKAFDDGTTVTFVSVQRSPCPNDPRPMPSPAVTNMFGPTATGGTRAFADRACTLPPRCP